MQKRLVDCSRIYITTTFLKGFGSVLNTSIAKAPPRNNKIYNSPFFLLSPFTKDIYTYTNYNTMTQQKNHIEQVLVEL